MTEAPRASLALRAGLLLLKLLAQLPLPLLHGVGNALGMLTFALVPGRRRVARTNIARCFPELSRAAQARVVRRHFRATGRSIFDVAVAWWGRPERLRRLVTFRNRDVYDALVRERRNLVLLAPHFVALDVGGLVLSMDHPIVSMYRHSKNPFLDKVIRDGRGRYGATLVERQDGLRPAIRAMREGRAFYYLPDQDPGSWRPVFAPFFGIEAATVPVIGRIARLANAVVLPVVTYQRPWGLGFEVVFHPPIATTEDGDEREDARRMNAVIESAVREAPEQYFWVHRRFKTRPKGEAGFYGG